MSDPIIEDAEFVDLSILVVGIGRRGGGIVHSMSDEPLPGVRFHVPAKGDLPLDLNGVVLIILVADPHNYRGVTAWMRRAEDHQVLCVATTIYAGKKPLFISSQHFGCVMASSEDAARHFIADAASAINLDSATSLNVTDLIDMVIAFGDPGAGVVVTAASEGLDRGVRAAESALAALPAWFDISKARGVMIWISAEGGAKLKEVKSIASLFRGRLNREAHFTYFTPRNTVPLGDYLRVTVAAV